MNAYKTIDSDIEELGEVTKEQIQNLLNGLDELDALLSEDKICSIGLCRSETDFMEIRPVGKSQYLIWSDRISASKGLMGKLFGKRHIEKVVEGRAQAIEAANFYMEHPRDEFEQKYS